MPGQRTTRARRLPATLLVLCLLVPLLGLAAGPAGAQAVGCGAVLTSDTTLTADLLDCPGHGLVIGADGITVDLGGHVVAGSLDGSGIDNSAGHDDVTVRNGTVREFARGVHLVGADRNRILGLQLADMREAGILVVGGGSGNRIEGNEIRDTSGGGGTAAIKVGTGPGTVRGTVIRRNTLRYNDNGVEVGAAATGTLVEANTLVGNTGTGVRIAGDRTVVRANLIDSDWPRAFTDVGVLVEPGARATRVEANAIFRFAFAGIDDSGRDTVVILNLLDGQLDPDTRVGLFGGILVRPEARRALVQANVVLRTAGDGIRVDSPATTITGNVANDNFDYGIEAVPGVTDGGGNRASGNGNPAQCLGVVCA
jgi:hypothetical protein